jgi:glycosyltransferase involved in cell wall biosynthesis
LNSLMLQTIGREKYEVVVVDNRSTDKTRKIVHQFNVRYLFSSSSSVYGARNEAVKVSKGKYLAFIDSDCIANQDWLQKGLEGLKNADLLSGKTEPQISKDRILYAYDKYIMRPGKYMGDDVNPAAGNMFCSRGLFEELDGFNCHSRTAADSLFAIQARQRKKRIGYASSAIVYHPVDSFYRRIRRSFREGSGSSIKAPVVYKNQSIYSRIALRFKNGVKINIRDLKLLGTAKKSDEISMPLTIKICIVILTLKLIDYGGIMLCRISGSVADKVARR